MFGATRLNLGSPVGAENFARSAPFSRPFWEALGFHYVAFDIAGAQVIKLDLNTDTIPPELKNSQNLVINGGTTEHVANQDNAFRCVHDLAKPQGVMVHLVPCTGLLIHGFFQYTLKFFWHLGRENGYQPLSLRLNFHQPKPLDPHAVNFGFHFGKKEPLRDAPDLREVYVCAIFQKLSDLPFVTPVDAPLH